MSGYYPFNAYRRIVYSSVVLKLGWKAADQGKLLNGVHQNLLVSVFVGVSVFYVINVGRSLADIVLAPMKTFFGGRLKVVEFLDVDID